MTQNRLSHLKFEETKKGVLLQETHCSEQVQLHLTCSISGFTLTAATYHSSYGTATSIKNDIKEVANTKTQTPNSTAQA